jgi:hypothetical protein
MSDPFYLLPLLTSTTLYLQVPYSSSYIRLVGRLLATAALCVRIGSSYTQYACTVLIEVNYLRRTLSTCFLSMPPQHSISRRYLHYHMHVPLLAELYYEWWTLSTFLLSSNLQRSCQVPAESTGMHCEFFHLPPPSYAETK